MRILFLLTLMVGLSVAAQAQEATDGPTGTIATGNDATQDADIAVRIRNILGELGNYDDVTVTVAEGIVALRGTTDSQAEVNALGALVTRIEGVVAIKNEVVETTDIARRLDPAVDRFQARLTQITTMLPLLLIAITVFAVIATAGYFLSRWRRPWDRLAPNSFIAALYSQLVMVIFVIAAIVVALDILDASALLGTILGAAGIVGLAFGFAVRDTVENYIASIMLSIRQPFRPNDTIEINGDEGKVIRLTSRATILLSFDGNHIRIPNATVFKSRIVNYSENAQRRFMFTLGVDPTADLSRARKIAAKTVQALPFVLDVPAAESWLDVLTEAGMQITVTGWIDQHDTSIVLAKGEAMRQVMLAFEADDILMPDPTYSLRVDGLSGTGANVTVTQSDDTRSDPARPGLAPAGARHATARPVDKTVEKVSAESESALDRIVDADRHDIAKQDLLSTDAKPE